MSRPCLLLALGRPLSAPGPRALARCYSSSLVMTSPVANPDIQLPLIWDSIPASKTKLKKCANNPRHSWHNEAHFLINAKLNPRWFRKDLVPKAIDRSFKFEYFTGALRFLTRVAEMNEKRREYPRLSYVGKERTSIFSSSYSATFSFKPQFPCKIITLSI